MGKDSEGFYVPVVDPAKCIRCGECLNICPVVNLIPTPQVKEPAVYASWTKDNQLLQHSSSGGVFSEISRYILAEGGVVFGAAYDEAMTVRHIAVTTWEDLECLRGSKYVQSDVADSFLQVRAYLEQDRSVLYSGTPCQVAGLYAAIGKKYDRLLTCDIICHGVPSPKVFLRYLESLEKRHKSKIINVEFRNKKYGWLYPTVRINFKNGKKVDTSNLDDDYNLGYLKNLFLRRTCYRCPFKQSDSIADMTIGDLWKIEKFRPDLHNFKGTSTVLLHNDNANHVIEKCRDNLELAECSLEFLRANSNLYKSVPLHPDRDAFFADLDQFLFNELIQKYIKPRHWLIKKIAQLRRFCRVLIMRM